MPIDRKHVGRTYGPVKYTLGLEKMREFAFAVAGGVRSVNDWTPPARLDPLFYDEEAARRGPYGAVIAYPTFAVNFAMAPFMRALCDPELGVDLLRVVHGEQDLEFLEVMRVGDEITTLGTLEDVVSKGQLEFAVVRTVSTNQHGNTVLRGTWTAVIR